jgi:hypothetical protein
VEVAVSVSFLFSNPCKSAFNAVDVFLPSEVDMENALPLFGLAAVLLGAGFVIHAVGFWWFRAKQLERANPPQLPPTIASAAVESRLARIETAVEAVAIEVERLGEANRFASRLGAEGVEAEDAPRRIAGPPGHDRS